MSSAILPGQEVPIALLLEDGSEVMFPSVEIRDSTDTLLSTVNLSHVAGGLYTGAPYVMPNDPWIVTTYITYSNAGRTVESAIHPRAIELFARDDAGVLAQEIHRYLGLESGTPSVHTPTTINAGAISQTVVTVASTVTKTRV